MTPSPPKVVPNIKIMNLKKLRVCKFLLWRSFIGIKVWPANIFTCHFILSSFFKILNVLLSYVQMSCFDRDHRVVVQRGTASGSAVSKNGPPSSAPTPPVAVRPSGSGVTSMVVTPRASKTVHTNSTIKLKNLKERLKDDSSPISPEAKLELEVGKSYFAFYLKHLYRFPSLLAGVTFLENFQPRIPKLLF